jgi:hypothetical protein
MKYDIISIIELCAICVLAFWLIGSCMLLVAVRKASDEFRSKGYLRTPSGTRWFRFLMYKQYDAFENPSTRFYFGAAHFCLVVMIVALAAIVILLGSNELLKGMSGLPGGGFTKPTL